MKPRYLGTTLEIWEWRQERAGRRPRGWDGGEEEEGRGKGEKERGRKGRGLEGRRRRVWVNIVVLHDAGNKRDEELQKPRFAPCEERYEPACTIV